MLSRKTPQAQPSRPSVAADAFPAESAALARPVGRCAGAARSEHPYRDGRGGPAGKGGAQGSGAEASGGPSLAPPFGLVAARSGPPEWCSCG